MANNNIEQRIQYRKGSNGDKPTGPKPNGSKPPFNLDEWLEELDPGGWQDEDNGDKGVKRPIPPQPYGADTFGWQEYENYLDKIGPGAIPIPFDNFMDQLDMLPSDQCGRRPRKKEGVMKVVAEPSSWQKKYLLNFFDRKYLDRLGRDDLEKLFDEFLLHRATKGRA